MLVCKINVYVSFQLFVLWLHAKLFSEVNYNCITPYTALHQYKLCIVHINLSIYLHLIWFWICKDVTMWHVFHNLENVLQLDTNLLKILTSKFSVTIRPNLIINKIINHSCFHCYEYLTSRARSLSHHLSLSPGSSISGSATASIVKNVFPCSSRKKVN